MCTRTNPHQVLDSLINYETVKIFGNEKYEVKTFNDSLYGAQLAALKTTSSLSLLNSGQVLIFSSGMF